MSKVVFVENALEELGTFPLSAIREVGLRLKRYARGEEGHDAPCLAGLAPCVHELRIEGHKSGGSVYVTRDAGDVVVLCARSGRTLSRIL